MYDYVILGGGAAGLSLAHRMHHHPFFADKKIALVEPDAKTANDRTWCYWSIDGGYYADVVHRVYPCLSFMDDRGEKDLKVGDYKYHMIRGIDFYRYNYDVLKSSSIDVIHDKVVHIQDTAHGANVSLESGKTLEAQLVFKSYIDEEINYGRHPYVDQHFKGWVIETERPTFDVSRATFMDFRIEQSGETRFMYVLPYSDKKALVEVAIFSNTILDQSAYDSILTDYIQKQLDIDAYTIEEEEFGIIPMTSYPFYKHNTSHVYGIGTMGGVVKPSSGFAFQRIQEHSDAIIDALVQNKEVSTSYATVKNRYAFYDKIFLHAVLNKTSGKEVFSRLFDKREAYEIFKFLDGETRITEDLRIFTAPPFMPFLTSMIEVL